MEKSTAASSTFLVLLLSVTVMGGGPPFPPTISVSPDPATVDETAGFIDLNVTITGSLVSSEWGFTFATAYGTADGSDFTAIPERAVSSLSTSRTITITVDILDDRDLEPGETFLVKLTKFFPVNPDINVNVTIIDDERTVELKQPADIAVSEDDSNEIILALERNDTSTREVQVELRLAPGTVDRVTDFHFTSLFHDVYILENATGETVILGSVIDDLVEEPTESFTVSVTSEDITNSITVVVSIIDNDGPNPFHCGRGKSQYCLNDGNCTNDGCRQDTGFCSCTSGFQGVNCGIEMSAITTTCSPACVSGTCVTGTCICDPGFAGEICDKTAYFYQCNPTNFSVCITPFSIDTFLGDIYVLNFKNVSACNLTLAPTVADPNDGIVDWCQGYAAVIPYNGTCGELGPSFSGNVTSYVLELFLQYTRDVMECTDEKVVFTCEFNNSLEVNHNIGVEDQSGSNDVTSVLRRTNQLVPAVMEVTARNGSSLPPILAMGTDVKINLSVENVPVAAGVIIHSLTIDNNRAGLDRRSLSLYDHGCAPLVHSGILIDPPFFSPAGQKHTVCFLLRLFVFEHDMSLSNPVLVLKVGFKVFTNAASAVMPVCSGRKKRQAEERDITLSRTFEITVEENGIQTVTKGDCTGDSTTWLVPAAIGFGLVAIAVAVIAIVLGLIITRRRRRMNMKETDHKSCYTH